MPLQQFTFKVLVAGPFAAGKTSLIAAVSQTPVVSTDVATSGHEAEVKASTTVAMDFGTFEWVDSAVSVKLLLFGGPGQKRLSFMTDILKTDADAVIFVVRPDSNVDVATEMLAELRDRLQAPLLIAVNCCDDDARALSVAATIGAHEGDVIVACQLNVHARSLEVMAAALELLDERIMAEAGQ